MMFIFQLWNIKIKKMENKLKLYIRVKEVIFKNNIFNFVFKF